MPDSKAEEKVWVKLYRIAFDALVARKLPRDYVEIAEFEKISEDEASRLNAAFKAAWPEAEP
jgi:hypothetical protein